MHHGTVAARRPPLSPQDGWLSNGRQVLHFKPLRYHRWARPGAHHRRTDPRPAAPAQMPQGAHPRGGNPALDPEAQAGLAALRAPVDAAPRWATGPSPAASMGATGSTVLLNPLCPFTPAKVLALKATVLLLLSLLIKAKIRITAFSALGSSCCCCRPWCSWPSAAAWCWLLAGQRSTQAEAPAGCGLSRPWRLKLPWKCCSGTAADAGSRCDTDNLRSAQAWCSPLSCIGR